MPVGESMPGPIKLPLIVVSGISGSGKSFLVASAAHSVSFQRIPSVTTRLPREGELDGIDKIFVDEPEFNKQLLTGNLICVAENFGRSYAHDRRLIESVKSPAILELATEAAAEFSHAFPQSIFVRIEPTSRHLAVAAVQARASDGTAVAERQADAGCALPAVVDWVVFDNHFDAESVSRFGRMLLKLGCVAR